MSQECIFHMEKLEKLIKRCGVLQGGFSMIMSTILKNIEKPETRTESDTYGLILVSVFILFHGLVFAVDKILNFIF